ncbi:orotidine-5'-phosphate decarboxylase [Patescibacteria group bacterium]
MNSNLKFPIIIALDYNSMGKAIKMARQLDPARCAVKVGKQLYTKCGPKVVKKLIKLGFKVFLDLKFHDIPNTVAAACCEAAKLGVWMINMHASGGRKMMEKAREEVDALELSNPPLLIAVTILTSLEQEDIDETGLSGTPADNVLRLAKLAHSSGMDGVVCSTQEPTLLREKIPSDFLLVTPGARSAGADKHDQARTTTPAGAIESGSDFLVIGRQVTTAPDPMEALAEIEAEITSVQ